MRRWWAWLLVGGCTAEDVGAGPTFGGSGVWSPELGRVDEAGALERFPQDVELRTCEFAVCVSGRAAWRSEGDLLVVLGVEGALPEPPPLALAFALDVSGSTRGSEDVRDAAVEIAAERLDAEDTLRLVAFRSEPVELLAATPMDAEGRAEVSSVLRELDRLPVFQSALRRSTRLLEEVGVEPCEADPEAVADALAACAEEEVPEGEEHPCGPEWPAEVDPLIDGLEELAAAERGVELQLLACDQGTDVAAAVDEGLAELPDGDATQTSRLVLVSDLDGGEAAVGSVDAAGARFVGTTVLGVTAGVDREAGRTLARAPGARFLDAGDPSLSLAGWDLSFERLVHPTSFGLRPRLSDDDPDWTQVDVIGETDREGLGANVTFASEDHGVLGLLLSSAAADPGRPVIEVTALFPSGPETTTIRVPVPVGLERSRGHRADDLAALRFALVLELAETAASGGDPRELEAELARLDARIAAAREP